jgi:all-trans-retinol 13,14-reductase
MSANAKLTEPYHLNRSPGPWDAIVIGSGIGGLAAAALLCRCSGKRVLVLERHYTPGGFTHTFRRPGYEWDVGVHYVGQAGPGQPIKAMFDAVTDGSLQWAPLGEVYDRIVIGSDTYELRAGADHLRRDLKRHFPREVRAIDRYFAMVAEVVAASGRYFMAKALPAPVAALAGPLLRRGFMRYAERTTRSVLEELTQDQRLIAVLTGQWGDFGLPPAQSSFAIHAIVANHYFEGAYYPVGGAGRIFEAIAPVIEAGGGKILITAEVSGIAIENGHAVGVTMKDGAMIRAPLVISDAGVMNTFGRLIAGDVGERFHPDPRALEPSIAHLCLYLGLRHTADELGLPKSNLWIYPDEAHERTFANALEDPGAALPPVYISFPSAKDPDFARRHPGRATIDVITFTRGDAFARWNDTRWKKRPEEYGAMKERLTARLLEVVYRHLPQIKGGIDVCELSTPNTTRHFSNYANGEIYGLAHTPARFREALLRPHTPIRGLFLTGQDVTVCGVAGALMGGALCASAILRRNLVRSISTSSQPAVEEGAAPP